LLREVQQYGTDVQMVGVAVEGGTKLPPQTFDYQGAR